jgi:hypothetical protein
MRLFMISGLIVAAVLTALMLVRWTCGLAFKTERLEQSLCMEAKRITTQPFLQLGYDISHKSYAE